MITYKKQQREYNVLQECLKWFVDIILVICFTYMVAVSLFNNATVVGHSMEKNIANGDKVLIDKFSYALAKPKRFDVVIFEPRNEDAVLEYSVKRIIGLPGETIRITDGKIYINDEELEDDIEGASIYDAGIAKEGITLGDNQYFVLGDNRNNSEDSRQDSIGVVSKEQIIGRIWLIYSPVEHFEIMK